MAQPHRPCAALTIEAQHKGCDAVQEVAVVRD